MATRVTNEQAHDITQLLPAHDMTYYASARIMAPSELVAKAQKKAQELQDEHKVRDVALWTTKQWNDTQFLQAHACVLCAGTSDLPVSEEAAVTLGTRLMLFLGWWTGLLMELAIHRVGWLPSHSTIRRGRGWHPPTSSEPARASSV